MSDPHPSGPHRVPFPSLRAGGAVLGAGILDEVPEEYAAVLMQSYRNVEMWARLVADRRAELFAPGAAEHRTRELERLRIEDDELRVPLEVIRDLLARPADSSSGRVGGACIRIAHWAEGRGAQRTRYDFTTAAVWCLEKSATIAYRAGCLARQAALWDEAEFYFNLAIQRGSRYKDQKARVMGVMGLGNACYLQGRYEEAQEKHEQALKMMQRHKLVDLRWRALHDLFVMAVEMGEHKKARELAREAFQAYGRDNPRSIHFAHDVAYFWITTGHYRPALTLLRAVRPCLSGPLSEQVRVLANTGRAAGGCRDRGLYEVIWSGVWALAEQLEGQAGLPTALVELSYGAVSLGEWDHAEHAAAVALDIARQRGEMDISARAEKLLNGIGNLHVADAVPEAENWTGAAKEAQALAEEFARSLGEAQ